MTRDKKRIEASYNYSKTLNKKGVFDYEDMKCAFGEGVMWADANPKSPWISVRDDLPYRHKELLLSTGYHTVSVFTYKKGGACGIDSMINRSGKWEWEAWKENYLYWMPMPNLPKE